MPYTLQQLSDFEDIRTLKHRYLRGIDTADWDLVADLVAEDVTIDYRGGSYRVQLAGRKNLMEFLANSFTSDSLSMHQGHQPEIRLVGADSAEGLWYLEDVFISLSAQVVTRGTAIYRDRYVRQANIWKIAHSEYDRIIEMLEPLPPQLKVTAHHLARTGRPLDQRADISHLIQWTVAAH
jgi:hypothetical protein